MNQPSVFAIDQLRFSREDWAWPFSVDRRDEIAAHFEKRRAETPALWNGRVLMLRSCRVDGTEVSGRFFETRFADLMAWRDWGYPDRSVVNGFAMGAIRSADGAYLLGEMGLTTANAGHIYFPSGTPDPSDVFGDTVDLAASVMREVGEETGLRADDFEYSADWTAVCAGPSLALMRVLQAQNNADTLRARILDCLAQQEHPEFSDIRIVRSRADFDPCMPDFVIAFLNHTLAD